MTEDQQPGVPAKERKTSIHDIRNQDFVSRLLAATPPYLYSAPVGPNNFFFSDMLRSLVQAKNNENARNLQLQQAALARRPRKRSWSQHRPYYEHLKERKEMEEKMQQVSAAAASSTGSIEKPLELTNKQIFPIASKYSKHLETIKENALQVSNKIAHNSTVISNQNEHKQRDFEVNNHHSQAKVQQQQQQQQQSNYESSSSSNPAMPDPPAASLPPSDLALPPPPPVWYPSLYPPYGIDPLHFFIDLRVSGHIYDRKKETGSPVRTESPKNTSAENSGSATDALISKYRHGSAFTVPTPRNEKASSSAINLTAASNANSESSLLSDKNLNYNKIYDMSESKENHFGAFKNANYVLQNLPKLYSQFAARDSECLEINSVNDSKSEEPDDDDDVDELKENSGHIDVELIGERCQSPDDDDDVIHQID